MGSYRGSSIIKWAYTLAGPVLALIAFIITFYFDPLNFGSQQPLSAIPAFLLSIIILIINQNISTNHEMQRASIYSDRIYEAIKDYMHVTPAGSPENAMQYIIGRIPILREVKNTSFNIEGEIERADEKFYKTSQYYEAKQQIANYSTRGMIWKDLGDRYALDRFRSIHKISNKLSKSRESKYKFKLLIHNEPQINFIILEYKDGNREVLFNWDFRGIGQDPTVLLSRDRQIIEMFSIQYEHLWRKASLDHDNTETKSTSVKYD
ncbi:hypothetical protein [Sessilibacter corallicola]|uniref:hypothetical protein n=1 Tax=Sessilibacter corallicola TaxID=2904075 RepID=UPI001E553F7D|nr:hypothetical protein [Sessilibacter corallicola]MCE2027496.1 hypothetical protein [Sessilibacter corallicola]